MLAIACGRVCIVAAGPLGTPASPAASADSLRRTGSIGRGSGVPVAAATRRPPIDRPPIRAAPASSPTVQPPPTASPAATTLVRAYFMLGSFTGNAGLVPVLRQVPETKASHAPR